MKTDSVRFYIPSTMTDLNLIIFFLDYTLFYLAGLISLNLQKEVRKIVCLWSSYTGFKISLNAEYTHSYTPEGHKYCKLKRFKAALGF
jgi:hypothetical protein